MPKKDEMRVEFMLAGYYQIITPMEGFDIIMQLSDPYSDTKRETWLRVFHNKIDVTNDILGEIKVDLRPTGDNFWGLLNLIRIKIAQQITKEDQS